MPGGSVAVIFDCEFLTDAGAPQRFWCGPDDPDPIMVQIGAVRLSLTPPFEQEETLSLLVAPRDRVGAPVPLPPLFTRLTGIDAARIAADGRPLADVLDAFAAFCGDAPIWSWGKDEFNAIAISCYVAGIAPPLPAARFGNATRLLARAGVTRDTIHDLRSNTLPGHFGLNAADLMAHDACDDARAVARVLRHLLRDGRLAPGDFALPAKRLAQGQ